MLTKQLYLDDSYLKEVDATILQVVDEGQDRYRLQLDQTVFYPMGGGQATDQGVLTSSAWTGNVYQVVTKEGEIWHYVSTKTMPSINDKVHGAIHWERRYLNMKKHSAGHIVDFAMYILGYSPVQLVPFKGDHDKKLYITYQGALPKDIIAELQLKVNELIQKNLHFSTGFESLENLKNHAIYLQPNLPVNKPLRMLSLESVGAVADGGTQVHSTGEVGKITIVKIVTENNLTTVYYSMT